jgi:site-specific DNA recombinase
MATPWAGYIRVSHVGGREGERFRSPKEQADRIEAWARPRGEEVVLLTPELDESGGRVDRPILTEAVEGIERGRYRGLVVAYLSRASRSVKHLLELWERIETAGGEVVAVAESIDTSTPAGRLTRTVLAAIAEHELDLHRERFEELRRIATANGIWQRRQAPLGYRRDPQTRRLVPDENAPRVRSAFRSRARGRSILAIARELRLTPSGARNLLRNRVYLGELRVGSHVNPSAHEPLVSEDDWLTVHGAMASRPARSRPDPALLAGLVRCASCGHVMSRATTATYSCHRVHSAGDCPRPAAITKTTLDRHVERVALAELVKLETRASSGPRVDELRAELRAAQHELEAYLEGVAAAGLSVEQYAKGARLRRDELDHRREKLAEALARQAAPVDGDPLRVWDELDSRQRNQLLRGLFECVLVAPAGRGRRVAVADRIRVIAHGAGLVPPYRGGGRPLAIARISLPDRDDPVVLGMDLLENALEDAGSRVEVGARS